MKRSTRLRAESRNRRQQSSRSHSPFLGQHLPRNAAPQDKDDARQGGAIRDAAWSSTLGLRWLWGRAARRSPTAFADQWRPHAAIYHTAEVLLGALSLQPSSTIERNAFRAHARLSLWIWLNIKPVVGYPRPRREGRICSAWNHAGWHDEGGRQGDIGCDLGHFAHNKVVDHLIAKERWWRRVQCILGNSELPAFIVRTRQLCVVKRKPLEEIEHVPKFSVPNLLDMIELVAKIKVQIGAMNFG